MAIRKGTGVWQGNLPEGNGTVSTESGVLKDNNYSFKSRFENGDGTNPEELIAAAHAGCFSMALSHALAEAGFTPEKVVTDAHVKLEKQDDGFAITGIKLVNKSKVPGIEQAKFDEISNGAKTGCPVSKALKAVDISLEATLEN